MILSELGTAVEEFQVAMRTHPTAFLAAGAPLHCQESVSVAEGTEAIYNQKPE